MRNMSKLLVKCSKKTTNSNGKIKSGMVLLKLVILEPKYDLIK